MSRITGADAHILDIGRASPGARGLSRWPATGGRGWCWTGARVVVGDGTVARPGHGRGRRRPHRLGGRRRVPGGPRPDDRVVDLGGRTVMPGMVNCHFHATYHNLGAATAPFGLEEPMAMQVVRAVTQPREARCGPASPAR